MSGGSRTWPSASMTRSTARRLAIVVPGVNAAVDTAAEGALDGTDGVRRERAAHGDGVLRDRRDGDHDARPGGTAVRAHRQRRHLALARAAAPPDLCRPEGRDVPALLRLEDLRPEHPQRGAGGDLAALRP